MKKKIGALFLVKTLLLQDIDGTPMEGNEEIANLAAADAKALERSSSCD